MDEILTNLSGSNEQIMKIVIAVIAILVIVSIVRSVYRLIMPVVIIGLVLVVFLGVSPNDVINKGKQLASSGSTFILESIFPYIHSNNGEGTDSSGDPDKSPGSLPFTEEDLKNFFNDEENKDTDIFEESESENDINKL